MVRFKRNDVDKMKIEGFNKYTISKKGVVCGTNSKKGLKPQLSNAGYYRVNLYKNRKMYHKTIHRLVASAFIKNTNNLPQVNHLDNNKLNNSLDNLEWCSSKDNVKHSYNKGNRIILVGEQCGHKLTEKDVLNIRKKYIKEKGLIWLASLYNVNKTTIFNVVHNQTWRHLL